MESKGKTIKQEIASYIMLCFFAAWNICFFMPIDIYFPNADNIVIPVKPLAACLGIVSLTVFAVMLAVCLLMRGKANRIFRTALFGVSIAFYIQGGILAVNMGEMNGTRYTLSFWKTALSVAVWLVIMIGVFVLQHKLPEELDGLIPRIAAALFIVQIVALGITAFNSIPKYTAEQLKVIANGESIPFCSAKDFELYSNNKNVIIFIADEYDSYLFDYAANEEPDRISEFDGFTYYTNALGRFPYTDLTFQFITSGDGSDNTYSNTSFFESAAKNYKANFYCTGEVPPASVTERFCNNTGYMNMSFGEAVGYTADVYRLAFFRCVPEPLKPLLWFDGQKIGDRISDSLDERVTESLGAGLYESDNLKFYNNLPRELVKTDENVFKVIYINGIHSVRRVTKDLEYIPNISFEVSPAEEAMAVNTIFNEYLGILKENGVYDNSEIIFMADHGLTAHLDKMYPVFMYKPANQTETGIKISKAPISYDELFPTFKMLAGAEPGGRTIFDIAEDEQRVRFFHFDNTEITETEKPQ